MGNRVRAPVQPATPPVPADLPVIAIDLPVMYEDEGQEEMGDSLPHTTTEAILRFGLMAHLAGRPGLGVLANMNLYYHRVDRWAYVSPDVMVVAPPAPLPRTLTSYRIGEQGPAPELTAEVLSRRSAQQGDLTLKPEIYARLGIREYVLVDVTGQFLSERLLLRTLDGDGSWIDHRDQGRGILSRLGFRLVIDADGDLRVIDETTGHRYSRPDETNAPTRKAAEADAWVTVEDRLRGTPPTDQ